MSREEYFSIKFKEENGKGSVVYLSQTLLPLEEKYVETSDYERIAEAIEKLEVRAAPLIGISAAYALVLSVYKKENPTENFYKAVERLSRTRPTAVNLFWAIEEIKKTFEENKSSDNIYEILDRKSTRLNSSHVK